MRDCHGALRLAMTRFFDSLSIGRGGIPLPILLYSFQGNTYQAAVYAAAAR